MRFILRPDGSSGLDFATANFPDIHYIAPQALRQHTDQLFTLVHPEDFDQMAASITQAARDVRPWLAEYRIQPPGQAEVRWLRSCLVPHRGAGGSLHGYGVLSDVTLEKNSRGGILALCEHGPVGIFRTTLDGRYLSVNANYARFCGYASPEELLRRVASISEQSYMQPEERQTILGLLETHGALQRYALELRTRDGDSVWLSLNMRALRDVQGRIQCCEGYCADITGQMRRELARGECSEFFRTSFGEGGAPDEEKPAEGSSGGLCSLLSFVRDTILWRLRLPMLP